MDLGPYSGFILSSYAICGLTLLSLIAWVVLDKKAQDKALKDLADQGISRSNPSESKDA